MNNEKINIYYSSLDCDDISDLQRLVSFLQSSGLNVDILDGVKSPKSPYFQFDSQLNLHKNDVKINYDWVQDFELHKKKKYSISKEPFAKALGLKKKKDLNVVDVSGGTGKDAILAYSFGVSVDIYERNPYAFCLLACAFLRFKDSKHYSSVTPMTLNYGSLTQDDSFEQYDCVFFDPMYPQKKKKSARSRKEMEAFKELVGSDEDSLDFLRMLIRIHPYVVLKRPGYAPTILNPSYSYEGRTTRYDIYRKS